MSSRDPVPGPPSIPSRARPALLASILAHSADGMAYIDSGFVIRAANEAYAMHLHRPLVDVLGRSVEEVAPGRTEQMGSLFQEVRESGKAFHARAHPFTFEDQPERGVTYWDRTISPVVGIEGAFLGYLLIDREVTDQVLAERERRQLLETMKEANELQEMQKDLLHAVSHDLRTPLTAITGHAQLLLRSLRKGDQGERLVWGIEAVLTGAERMNAMIQDLATLGHLESGSLRLHREAVCLGSFIADLLERDVVALEVGRVVVKVPDDLPPVQADPNCLERIFTNLLGNALKYSPPDTEVLVTGEDTGDEVKVSVRDLGPGIAPEDLPRVFDRFYRARAAGNVQGLGLGLYVSRILVAAHGGRIWAESEPGKGSSFSFTLPSVVGGEL